MQIVRGEVFMMFEKEAQYRKRRNEEMKGTVTFCKNDGDNVKLTWISAGLIKTYGVPSDGGKDDIVEDSVATSSAVIADMIGSF